MKKVDFPIDKRKWAPSLIPGPIVFIATRDAAGQPNVAPKSWLQMVSFEPPLLMFAGTAGNPTESNILATRCFSVNFIDRALAAKASGCLRWRGQERIDRTGLRLVPAAKIQAPLVDDCPAHLECELEDARVMGGSLVVFGRIVQASVREDLVAGTGEARYAALDPVLFLEDGLYAGLGRPWRVTD